ncbi:pyruvate formate lyase family protein [uncultured Draconibacterium sp.]|uniref:pyruvate formate lyase family protein n=1 Tax=uncultured Draconibacterium sp. TaxID=1573823 RepID=UPI0029C0594B|nr:pyruvate formate lyase family protein [uncultured Draconibacterium sp.]
MEPLKKFRYQKRIDALRTKKLAQTQEKIKIEGLLDEDDYGRIVPPEKVWKSIPNHPDGSFYGLDGWTNNFCDLMEHHSVYVDPNDAFAGRWMYFMSRMRANKWNPDYPYDHLQPNIDKYNLICGIGDDAHFAPDYKLGIRLGWQGLLDKIEKYRKINTSEEQQQFYDAHERVIKSIQVWIKNHIEAIRKMILNETNPELADNLKEMLEVNENIISAAPKTLREACQWIIWYHLASRTYNRDGAGGQIDTLLQPFYEKDLAAGRIDHGKTVYYLACFLINDPIYWQLGGPDKDGNEQASDISYLILEAGDKINTSLNITVRVHDGMDEELFKRSVYYLIKNKNAWPRFSGDKALVEGFMKNGFDAATARQRIAVGCNWMSLPGMEYTMNDLVKVNMAKVFEVAYFEMMADKSSENSTSNLWERFSARLAVAVKTAADGVRHHLKYQKYNEPELILNLLSHGPLEKGRDVVDGGAQYYNLSIDGAGLAVVADSLAALEQRIENEQKISWEEILYHVESNFEEAEGERIRLLMKNSERYAQGNSLADKWADNINELFTGLVRKESDEKKGHLFIPGFFSWANTVGFGKAVGATPNGRKSQTPISHGANPNPGFTADAASLAMASAIARIQPGYGNTAPMQWELDPSLAKEEHAELIGSIIKTHFNMGGTLINVNIMDKEKVLEAHKDPTKYSELVVRITGFTAYFSMLTPEFRQLVVDRILES